MPLFIEKLAPEPAYVGRELQALLLRSPEQGPPLIHFAMSTEREQADDAPLLLDNFLQKLSRANP